MVSSIHSCEERGDFSLCYCILTAGLLCCQNTLVSGCSQLITFFFFNSPFRQKSVIGLTSLKWEEPYMDRNLTRLADFWSINGQLKAILTVFSHCHCCLHCIRVTKKNICKVLFTSSHSGNEHSLYAIFWNDLHANLCRIGPALPYASLSPEKKLLLLFGATSLMLHDPVTQQSGQNHIVFGV